MLSRLSSRSLTPTLRLGSRCLPLPCRKVFTVPSTLRYTLRTSANAFSWPAKTQSSVTTSKLQRFPFSSSSVTRTASSEAGGGTGDDDNGDETPSHSNGGRTHETEAADDDGDDGPTTQVTVTTHSGPRIRGAKGNYRWKYRRSYTPGDVRNAAQNNEPVYFMITPPDQPDPGLLRDVYMDTSTLEWLYDPPIPVIAAQIPEHMNLSTIVVLYHPSSQQLQQRDSDESIPTPIHLGTSPHSFAHDYYMFTSYVMPAAQLVVSGHTDHHGYYFVGYKVTTNPSAIYYDYNSLTQRYALFELRNGPNGAEKIYLIPVPPNKTHNRKVIRGKLLQQGDPVPDSYFTFMVFSANIHIYVPDLPTL